MGLFWGGGVALSVFFFLFLAAALSLGNIKARLTFERGMGGIKIKSFFGEQQGAFSMTVRSIAAAKAPAPAKPKPQ